MSSNNRQQVLNLLGDKEGSAGKAIVDFVEETVQETLRNNHEELVALIKENNKTVQEALALKADKTDIDEINRRLHAAADALRGASTAHDTAARAANADSAHAEERAQEAQAATNEAGAAVSEAKLSLESLHERLENVERWRTHHQPDIDWARQQRLAEEHEASRVPLINQPPVHDEHEHDHRYVDEHPHTQAMPVVGPHHHRHEEVVHARRHYYNPAHWNWIQWVLALALGLALTATLGIWLRDLTSPVLHEWSWLWLLVTFLIGFFGGGLLGSIWDTREQEYDEQTVVRREHEHDDHDDRTVVRLRA